MILPILLRSKTPSGTAYTACGHGPPVLLLHGVGLRAEAFYPQIIALSRKARVFALDLPGHGHTPALVNHPDLRHFTDWFCRTVDELGFDCISLLGHSMGALIATGFAGTSPQRLHRVALLNGVHRRSQTARAAVLARADAIQSGTFDQDAPLSRWFHAQERGSPVYQAVQHLLHTVDTAGYAAAYRAFAQGDAVYADSWPQVPCPALFLTGDGDLNSTPQMARQMADAAPNGQAVIIAGHRHMVNLTASEQVNRILLKWLDWHHLAAFPHKISPCGGTYDHNR